MICVGMAAGYDINKPQPPGLHRQSGHSDVWGRLVCVFSCEGIREIGIQEQVTSLPLQEKTALPQPPKPEIVILPVGISDIVQELFVLHQWLNQLRPFLQSSSPDGSKQIP
jgi:hypothetical protein